MIKFLSEMTLFVIEVLKINILTDWILRCPQYKKYKWMVISIEIAVMAVEYACGVSEHIAQISLLCLIFCGTIILLKDKKHHSAIVVFGYIAISIVDLINGGIICTIFNYTSEFIIQNPQYGIVLNSISFVLLFIVGIIVNRKKEYEKLKENYAYYYAVLAVGLLIMASYISPIQRSSLLQADHSLRIKNIINTTACGIVGMGLCGLSTMLILKKIRADQQNSEYQKLMEQQRNYYNMLLKKDKETKKFRHDISNHLACIRKYIELGEFTEAEAYISEVSGRVQQLNSKIYTGNHILNIIIMDIMEKYADVQIKWEGLFPAEVKLSDMDMCILFSNLLKNAAEAAQKSDDHTITVTSKVLKDIVYVEEVNSVEERNKINIEYRLSAKREFNSRGYGINNMKEVLEKFDGTINYTHCQTKIKVGLTFLNA